MVSALSPANRQTDEQDFQVEERLLWRDERVTLIDNECVLWLCCNCQLIANWMVEPRRQPGIKSREMAVRGLNGGGSHQSLFGAGHRGTSESTKRREASMYVWLARYRSLSVWSWMTLQIPVNEWKSDALHVPLEANEWR